MEEDLQSGSSRVCVVTDSNVGKLYLEEVMRAQGSCKELTSYTIPAGEERKNLDEIRSLCPPD